MTNPVIFIGAHRSGTSMLGRLLEQAGLFVGTWKDSNNESIFFQNLNKWQLRQCGARWDTPKSIEYLFSNNFLIEAAEAYINNILSSIRAIQFLGPRRYFLKGGISRLDIPWGWKDPRNTFTLPLWLRIFPEAKIIHIERHGVDVAQSLVTRSQRVFTVASKNYERWYRHITPFIAKRGGFTDSPRCMTLDGGFSLWLEYREEAEAALGRLPKERTLRLRYEDILQRPAHYLKTAAEFCALHISAKKIEGLTAHINPERAYAFRRKPELIEFVKEHRLELNRWGYE